MGKHKITILDKEQQEAMRKVCRLAREVLDLAAKEVRPGVTTDYLDEIVHNACMEREVCDCPMFEIERIQTINIGVVISIASKLLQVSKILLYLCQRIHLSWNSRSTRPG